MHGLLSSCMAFNGLAWSWYHGILRPFYGLILTFYGFYGRISSWLDLIRLFSRSYSDLQKHESSYLLSDWFSCISPEPLELKKSYLHPYLKSFQMKEEFFQIRLQNQLIFAKNAVLTEKSKLLEKIRHFEKFKNFFSWI